jgi:Ca2+-binding EF-hand superfamily protein
MVAELPNYNPDDAAIVRVKDNFMLNDRQVRRVAKLFARVDLDKSGTIDIEEFHAWIRVPQTRFTREIFNLVDLQASELTFPEFLLLLATYCMLVEKDIIKCFYQFCDETNSGECPWNNLVEGVQLLHTSELVDPHTGSIESQNEGFYKEDQAAMDQCYVELVHIHDLLDLHRRFPHVLMPAFAVQEAMMNTVFGNRWWTNNRIKLARLRGAERERHNKTCEENKKIQRKWFKHKMKDDGHLAGCHCCCRCCGCCNFSCACYLWSCWNVFRAEIQLEEKLVVPKKLRDSCKMIGLDKIAYNLLMDKLKSEERQVRRTEKEAAAAAAKMVLNSDKAGAEFAADPETEAHNIVTINDVGAVTEQPTRQETGDMRRERSRHRMGRRRQKEAEGTKKKYHHGGASVVPDATDQVEDIAKGAKKGDTSIVMTDV